MKSPQKYIVVSLAAAITAILAASTSTLAAGQADLGPTGAGPLTRLGPQEATTYFNYPIQKLKVVVPGLNGIKYDDSQKELPVILGSVAKKIADVLPRLPDLISREDVFHFQSTPDPNTPGGLPAAQPWGRQYKYLLQCRRARDGSTFIAESRVDAAGKPVEATAGGFTAPRGYGFGYLWLFFSAASQPEFHFRYLGEQMKGGRKTFVVAFAQEPSKVTHPAAFQVEGKAVPFYYQGVLWVDQSSFDIVALRTDLLAPLPQVHLKQLATELTFRSVPIHGYDAVFWLPSEVDISSDQGNGPSEENHRYSDYHLYHSTARILP
jgi:hypothetical protein